MLTQARLDELWDFDDPQGSEARFRDAIAHATRSERAELETQLARALGLQERYDEADAVLASIHSRAPAVRVRVDLERGRLLNSRGSPAEAVPHFVYAAQLAADEYLPFLLIDALHMLAIADDDRHEQWTATAFANLERVTDERTQRWRIALHNNSGWRHVDAGRYDEAIAEFELARADAERYGTAAHITWADEALAEARRATRSAD